MTPTCLGSPGAARILLAANIGQLGYMSWWLGAYQLELRPWCPPGQRWHLVGHWIDQNFACLLLRGLLAEGVVQEFVEWVTRDGTPEVDLFSFECDVLAKLHELEMIK